MTLSTMTERKEYALETLTALCRSGEAGREGSGIRLEAARAILDQDRQETWDKRELERNSETEKDPDLPF